MLRVIIALVALGLGPGAAAADGIMLVQAGAFWMGRDDDTREEAPLHRVYVRDFWIERHKVTNAEFATFLNARGIGSADGARRYDQDDADARIHLLPAAEQHAAWVADRGFEHHPVVEVSWFGARDYCAWKGRRLPTEAEWEKTARGDDRRRYPWGDAAPTDSRAVFGRPYNATEPTDSRPAGASPYDVHDLLGNLREWTATMLKPYPYRHDDGREPFTGAGSVVVRGGSHDDAAETLSATTRRSYDRRGAAAGHHHVGFRCATSEDLGGR
jgi:formylglycine-generating enzyme required for sulfatase activity